METNRFLQLLVLGVFALFSVSPVAAAESNTAVKWSTTLDRPLLVDNGEGQKVVLKIEIEGAHVERGDRMPLNLAIVLDRSGSMSGAKLEQAKQAATMLVDQLDRDDVVSLVVYESDVQVLYPAARLGDRRSELRRIIGRIQTGGSTALYGGVECGGRQLEEFLSSQRINRVMLLSDGIANVGPSSNREIAGLGSRLAKRGMSVTTIGLGDDYNETLMTALAEASDANYYYVADVEALPDVFRQELGELKAIVAREIEIRVKCPKGVRPLRFLGRPGELKSQEERLAFGTLSSEQTREVYLECLIDEGAIGSITEIADVSIAWADSNGKQVTAGTRPIVVGYTEKTELAEASVDRGVEAEAVIWSNAIETEKTIALADEGDFEASRSNIASQKAKLEAVFDRAPAAQQQILQKEIDSLDAAEGELKNNMFSKSQRKKLSSESYQTRNSKR